MIGLEETDLLVEDGFGLTTVTRLLAVIASFSLGEKRVLALLVLGHFVWAECRGKSGDQRIIYNCEVEGRVEALVSHRRPFSIVGHSRVFPARLALAV